MKLYQSMLLITLGICLLINLAFSQDNAFTVSSNSKVGIGTTNPT